MIHTRHCERRRPLATSRVAAAAIAMAAAASSGAAVAAFAPLGIFGTALRPARARTELLADRTPGDIATVSDDNLREMLHPPSSRPVLVDAYAPWCGPCKLLDKVLRKAAPRYEGRVDFCRWNVNDKEGTAELRRTFLGAGHTLTKLPSLIVFRDGAPVAVRPGFANDFQLDDFLERTLPDVLERTFDEDGLKIVPLPEEAMMLAERTKREEDTAREEAARALEEEALAESVKRAVLKGQGEVRSDDCIMPVECFERLEQTIWNNRTVVPAMDGVLLPARGYGSP